MVFKHHSETSSFSLSYELVLLGEYTIDYNSGSKEITDPFYYHKLALGYNYLINKELVVSSNLSSKLPYEVEGRYNSDSYKTSYLSNYEIGISLKYQL